MIIKVSFHEDLRAIREALTAQFIALVDTICGSRTTSLGPTSMCLPRKLFREYSVRGRYYHSLTNYSSTTELIIPCMRIVRSTEYGEGFLDLVSLIHSRNRRPGGLYINPCAAPSLWRELGLQLTLSSVSMISGTPTIVCADDRGLSLSV